MVIKQVMEFTAAEDLKTGDFVILDEDNLVRKVRASDLPVINRFVRTITKPVKENETFRREDWY